MKTQLNDVEKEKIAIAREYIADCKKDISAFNISFISSSVLCVILAALATFSNTNATENQYLTNLFYVLPSIYLLSLYNVIKYTNEQMLKQRQIFSYEEIINKELGDVLLTPDNDFVSKDKNRWFWGAAVQIAFDVPLFVIFMVGFCCNLKHDELWSFLLISIIIQVIVIFGMLFRLGNSYIEMQNQIKEIKNEMHNTLHDNE